MGEASLDTSRFDLTIHSTIIIYGEAADRSLALQIADDIAKCWNEPKASIRIKQDEYLVKFDIEGIYQPDLDPESVWYNDDPRLNFFRIEEFSSLDISFVDGLGCNTGYFKIANLKQTGTTVAHEYGHTLGLDHPSNLDIRGKGTPGIMYPRGTLCDPQFQYDPNAKPGGPGGTMDPHWRKVQISEITDLKLHKRWFDENGKAIVGDFSSLYHAKHG